MHTEIAIVAGPDPGHAIPAITLARLLAEANYKVSVYTGKEWAHLADDSLWDYVLLPGLAPRPGDDDLDSGEKLHQRAGHMARLLAPLLQERDTRLVIGDVITAGGGLAADLLGIPWIELHPHPLYYRSRYMAPVGSGIPPSQTIPEKIRDAIFRTLSDRALNKGLRQRAQVRQELQLPTHDKGPVAKLVATFTELEYSLPDWPEDAYIIGPLVDEPSTKEFPIPPGEGPLIVVSPSTAFTAVPELLPEVTRAFSPENFGEPVRLAICAFHPENVHVPFGTVDFGRQDILLQHADLAISGGGHGFLAKTLLAGVPSILVPGGGDQWEVANRAYRYGSSEIVRNVNATEITRIAQRMLHQPSYRHKAQALGSLHKTYDPIDIVSGILCN